MLQIISFHFHSHSLCMSEDRILRNIYLKIKTKLHLMFLRKYNWVKWHIILQRLKNGKRKCCCWKVRETTGVFADLCSLRCAQSHSVGVDFDSTILHCQTGNTSTWCLWLISTYRNIIAVKFMRIKWFKILPQVLFSHFTCPMQGHSYHWRHVWNFWGTSPVSQILE